MSVDNTAVIEHLDHINALLHNAVLTCKATLTAKPEVPVKFKEEDHFAPGQRLQQQWRFTQTTKTPSRKKKGTVLIGIIDCISVHISLFCNTISMLTEKQLLKKIKVA